MPQAAESLFCPTVSPLPEKRSCGGRWHCIGAIKCVCVCHTDVPLPNPWVDRTEGTVLMGRTQYLLSSSCLTVLERGESQSPSLLACCCLGLPVGSGGTVGSKDYRRVGGMRVKLAGVDTSTQPLPQGTEVLGLLIWGVWTIWGLQPSSR